MRRRRAGKQTGRQIEARNTLSSQQAGNSPPPRNNGRPPGVDQAGGRLLFSQRAGQPNTTCSMTNVRIYSNNCRGYTSKKESIEKYVIEQLAPDIINLEETMLKNKSKINHKDYCTFGLNRANGSGGGGIATMVANTIKKHATKVSENNDQDEYMIVRLEHVKPALNIVRVYGRIESRAGNEKILEGWKQFLAELKRIQVKQEAILILGDLNRAVGDGEMGVEGNKDQVSYGGSIIRDLIISGDFVMLNNLSLTTGGPWTRVCPGTGRKSCLDLAIGSRNLVPFVKMMMIDSSRQFTPRRAVARGGGVGVVFTDHFPSLIELEMPRSEETKEKPNLCWNTHKPGAWEVYKEESDKIADKINMIVQDQGFDEEEVMEKIDKIQTKLKFTAFGKSKPKSEKARKKVMEPTDGLEDEEAMELIKRQSKRIEEEIRKVKDTENGRVGRIFKMKELIFGNRKPAQPAQAIKHPTTGELIVSNSEIKKSNTSVLPSNPKEQYS